MMKFSREDGTEVHVEEWVFGVIDAALCGAECAFGYDCIDACRNAMYRLQGRPPIE